MTVLPIATVGDPVLRERAAEVGAEELASAGDEFLRRVAPYVWGGPRA